MKLKLVGAKRYNVGGELFLSHEADGRTETVYEVPENKAEYLLKQFDPQTGFGYFEEYKGAEPGKKPGEIQSEDRPERKERPRQTDRRASAASERKGPRNPDVVLRRQGRNPAPIEDSDASTV